MAAAAVIAIAFTLATVRYVLPTQPPFTHANFPRVPVYYVALNNAASQTVPDQIVVGDTFTRVRLATVRPPARGTFIGMTGAADDRTFVVETESFAKSAEWPVESRTWYLLRLAPGTHHLVRLARLPIPATPFGIDVAGIALSPDASKFAVELQPSMILGPEVLQIYSVATGAVLRRWTGPPSNFVYNSDMGTDNNATLSWLADGHTLVFDYGNGVRVLDMSRPGHDLIRDSRPAAWSAHDCAYSGPVVTSDGKTVACVAAGFGAAFLEYSTATGKLSRTLYQTNDYSDGEVLWVSSSGDTLIGYLNSAASPVLGESVGVITAKGFHPLSFPLRGGVPVPDGVAW